MKKIYLHFAIISASLLLATSAFSAGKVVGGGEAGTDIGGATFRTSTGVVLAADINDISYGAITKHTSGDTTYSFTSIDPTIVTKKTDGSIGTVLVATDAPAAPTAVKE